MKKTRITTLISLTLCLVLLCLPEPLLVQGVTNDSIKEKENQITQAQSEKNNLQNNLTDIKKLKEQLEQEKKNLTGYVAALDLSLAEIEANIAELNTQITEKEAEIVQIELDLIAAQEAEQKQYDCMVMRIRYIYETGDSYLLDTLFSASSFGDFLNQSDYLERIYSYDQEMWEEYQMIREYVELCKEQLELEKVILDEKKLVVEEEQKNMEALIQAKHNEIKRYEGDISNKEQAIKEYEAEIKEQNEFIAMMEAVVAEEKRKLLESNKTVISYDGGIFKFPMATYTRMSDDYGWRMHPTLNVEQFHNGVDFAAPAGTAIYAAYDGVVVAASYSSTMGNYVMIDHGDSLYTIYMHASALYVSKDAAVTKGQTIAA
ncbi:peptidoglycan DD-metalloendopeptidase family protein, partial [Lachnospiraceae bacterium OttesenSCG-928-D06]|nr:peptidoglycan DD-metalloendopeptidase family protein [Lachnospiraceae bacterium OttesenSCG-928-D06]